MRAENCTFPKKKPKLPERFRGRPILDAGECPPGCRKCVEACPMKVMVLPEDGAVSKCIACGICVKACPMELLEVVEK